MSFLRGLWSRSARYCSGEAHFHCFHQDKIRNALLSQTECVMKATISRIMRQISAEVNAASHERDRTYEEAVEKLNTLQSNAAYLAKTAAERDKRRHLQLPLTLQVTSRLGITPQDLNNLSVIHVTGTKGKGSTCAFTESILRTHGYKTGMFSSPHLIEVRERIRIGGRPLSRDAFTTYFWECYNQVESSKADFDDYMPPYFQFLTAMSLHVFLKEKVDVAILEVGIGGEYDSTNIIKHPVVCGIASLGLDHINILGDTLEKIAWHKAGIFKPGVAAFTVPQPNGSMEVLQNRAYEKGCPLYVTPDTVDEHIAKKSRIPLGIPGMKQEMNAALAVQLTNFWLQNHNKGIEQRQSDHRKFLNKEAPKDDFLTAASTFQLSEETLKGLQTCYWPGRCQTITRSGITFYVDGAHTPRSIQSCAQWFSSASQAEAEQISGKVVKVLLFNATGERKTETLFQPLLSCGFDCALFCPNITTTVSGNNADQTNHMVTKLTMLSKCQENQNKWEELSHSVSSSSSAGDSITHHNGDNSVINGHGGNNNDSAKADISSCGDTDTLHSDKDTHSMSFGCILEGLHWVSQGRDLSLPDVPSDIQTHEILANADHIQVLCTGSLHLVGNVLGIIEPNVCDLTRT